MRSNSSQQFPSQIFADTRNSCLFQNLTSQFGITDPKFKAWFSLCFHLFRQSFPVPNWTQITFGKFMAKNDLRLSVS